MSEKHSISDWAYDESSGQVNTPAGTICEGITWKPNGYLIESAPDLLAVLERTVQALEHWFPRWGDPEGVMQQARIVIAKAYARDVEA